MCENRFCITDAETGGYLVRCKTISDANNNTSRFDDPQIDGDRFGIHRHVNRHRVALSHTDFDKSVRDAIGEGLQLAIGKRYQISVVFALRNNSDSIRRGVEATFDDVEFMQICCDACCILLWLGVCGYRLNAQGTNHHLPKRVPIPHRPSMKLRIGLDIQFHH